ncbi:metal/formaldehyde-sensitive transcriptional repressor [Verrucomicrobiota bacterium sgz303538]
MAHTSKNKKSLLNRINRLRGQLNGVATALEEERDCGEVLLALASCRGSLNALMAEIMEGHVREHLLSPDAGPDSHEAEAAEELIKVIRRYLH